MSQSIIVHTLDKSGSLNKADVVDALDFFIKSFETKKSPKNITSPMKHLKKLLNQNYPDLPFPKESVNQKNTPAWLQGVLDGGLSKIPESDDS
jgi:hypothetical protein